MAIQQVINVGTLPNDGDGDPLRVAFQKTNNNFSALFATDFAASTANTIGDFENQIILSTAIDGFKTLSIQIRSADSGANSQLVTLSAQISNDNSNVSYSGYGTSFIGTAVCSYTMDVYAGNVRVLCTPFGPYDLTHRIATQIILS